MKKYLILIISLFVLSTNVNADENNHVYSVYGKDAICIDAINLAPCSDDVKEIIIIKHDTKHAFLRGLLPIGVYWINGGDPAIAAEAARKYVIDSGNYIGGTPPWWAGKYISGDPCYSYINDNAATCREQNKTYEYYLDVIKNNPFKNKDAERIYDQAMDCYNKRLNYPGPECPMAEIEAALGGFGGVSSDVNAPIWRLTGNSKTTQTWEMKLSMKDMTKDAPVLEGCSVEGDNLKITECQVDNSWEDGETTSKITVERNKTENELTGKIIFKYTGHGGKTGQIKLYKFYKEGVIDTNNPNSQCHNITGYVGHAETMQRYLTVDIDDDDPESPEDEPNIKNGRIEKEIRFEGLDKCEVNPDADGCKPEDEVKVYNKCNEKDECNPSGGTQMYVKQMDLKDIVKTSPYVKEKYQTKFKKINDWCDGLITSETNEINLPGGIMATSGQYFVFEVQPNIKGTMNVHFNTYPEKYEEAYKEALSKANASCGQDETCLIDKKWGEQRLEELPKEKEECITVGENLANEFEYKFEPILKFTYEQDFFDGQTKSLITLPKDSEMVISYEPVKYWPNKSTSESKSLGGSWEKGYEATFIKDLYFRPNTPNYYVITSTGELVENKEGQVASELGYVYEIKHTTYKGKYDLNFEISNLGHGGTKDSNIYKVLKEDWTEEYGWPDETQLRDGITLKNTCSYCNELGIFKRKCNECDEDDFEANQLVPGLIIRNVALNDLFPNDRSDTNWSDIKGITAKEIIESNTDSTISIIQKEKNDQELKNSLKEELATLENKDDLKVKTLKTANVNIYDDNTKAFLEYEIELTTQDMQLIRESTKNINYSRLNECASNSAPSKTNWNYCFTCDSNAKECKSEFLDAYSNMDITENSRLNKWKYFVYDAVTGEGSFKNGSIAALLPGGKYPEFESVAQKNNYLKTYKAMP